MSRGSTRWSIYVFLWRELKHLVNFPLKLSLTIKNSHKKIIICQPYLSNLLFALSNVCSEWPGEMILLKPTLIFAWLTIMDNNGPCSLERQCWPKDTSCFACSGGKGCLFKSHRKYWFCCVIKQLVIARVMKGYME